MTNIFKYWTIAVLSVLIVLTIASAEEFNNNDKSDRTVEEVPLASTEEMSVSSSS